MTSHVFGALASDASDLHRARDAGQLLGELSLSFVPLSLVTEWSRCGAIADFVGRYFASDFRDREHAGSVLSTVVNELVENAAKFSSDKTATASLSVHELADRVTIVTTNAVTPAQGVAFGDIVSRVVADDPEAMFADAIGHPPETGGAGIGLIVLRKDYGATIGVRLLPPSPEGVTFAQVEVSIDTGEVDGDGEGRSE
jgi:hypothetical protein